MDALRKKLIYRSWHRGTKEMDIILGRFADAFVSGFQDNELADYDALLAENDPDLYNWLTHREEVPQRLSDNKALDKLIASQK